MKRELNQSRTLLGALLLLGATALGAKLVFPASPMEMSDEQLDQLVNPSTLTFTGTVVEKHASNVSGFNSENCMIVEVEDAELGDQQALKQFGYLKGVRLTVDPSDRITSNVLQKNMFAVFFADPWVYGTNIGVTANAIPIPDITSKNDFLKRLQAAGLRKSEIPLRREVVSAQLIVTGDVEAVRPLGKQKAAGLAKVDNGWELTSEHGPRWMVAVIKVQSVLKPPKAAPTPDQSAAPTPSPAFVAVVFPGVRDCFGAMPQFELTKSGIWLLHDRNQLDQQETTALLTSEDYNSQPIQTYTALDPADFQDLAQLNLIQQIITETIRKP